MKRVIVLMIGGAALLWAVVVRGNLDVLGTLTAKIVDFASSTATTPMQTGTTLPGTCTVGQAFFKTDATPGQNIYLCTAANTWTQVQVDGNSFDWKRNLRYISLFTDFNQIDWGTDTPVYAGDFTFYKHQGTLSTNGNIGFEPTTTRAGFLTFAVPPTSGSIAHWTTPFSISDSTGLYYHSNKPWRIEFAFMLSYYFSDWDNADAVVGLIDRNIGDPPTLFGVGVRSSVGSGFYWVTASNNTWLSAVPTGVPADTGETWHKVVLRSDGTTPFKFWASMDGGAEVSVCESGCDITMSAFQSYTWSNRFGIFLKTSEDDYKIVILDYLSFWLDRGTTR